MRLLSMSRALPLQRWIDGSIERRADRCDRLSALDDLTSVRDVTISVEDGVQGTNVLIISYQVPLVCF